MLWHTFSDSPHVYISLFQSGQYSATPGAIKGLSNMSKTPEVSLILDAINSGDPGAEARLMELVYSELREMASFKLAKEKAGHSLSPTALVNEAYLKLFGTAKDGQWNSRGHFFSAAAHAMRQILIDHARKKMKLKRGGDRVAVDLDLGKFAAVQKVTAAELVELDNVLTELESEDPSLVKLVELRFFNSHTIKEAAEILEISVRTANRNWQYAKARLWQLLEK